MRRRRIEIEIVFLHVLAVVPLAVGQPEQPFLEDRVFAVPERERRAEVLVLVANPGKAVFAPAIRSRAGLIVREVLPSISAVAVILAHGPPLPFAEIRPPVFPR